MHRARIAAGVGGFTREEEAVPDGRPQRGRRVEPADRNVAIGAARVGIPRPVDDVGVLDGGEQLGRGGPQPAREAGDRGVEARID